MTKIPPRARLVVGVAAFGAGLLCLAVIIIPVAEAGGVAGAPWFRLALRPACHQIGDRCLDLGSGPLAVCARCSGLYAGGFLGLLATAVAGRRFRPSWKIVGIAAAPSVIDFFCAQIGLPSLTNWPRFWLAAPPAFLVGLLLADAIVSIAEPRTESSERPIT